MLVSISMHGILLKHLHYRWYNRSYQKAEVDNFRKSIPVDVVLHISDEMLSPKLDFNIELPTYTSSGFSGAVKAKLDRLRESESEDE